MVDRKSRLTCIAKVEHRTAMTVSEAIIRLLKKAGLNTVETITCDNGKEFTNHANVAQALKTHVYFSHPRAAWEQSTDENTNCLIRQYFPKGSYFENITKLDVWIIMKKLNNRP